eukprot:COSAG02_NODE_1753_length_11053_cov_5.509129_6_plen_233_part_00
MRGAARSARGGELSPRMWSLSITPGGNGSPTSLSVVPVSPPATPSPRGCGVRAQSRPDDLSAAAPLEADREVGAVVVQLVVGAGAHSGNGGVGVGQPDGGCGVVEAMQALAELGAYIPEPSAGGASCVGAPGVLLSLAGGRVASRPRASEAEVIVEEARPQVVARPGPASVRASMRYCRMRHAARQFRPSVGVGMSEQAQWWWAQRQQMWCHQRVAERVRALRVAKNVFYQT